MENIKKNKVESIDKKKLHLYMYDEEYILEILINEEEKLFNELNSLMNHEGKYLLAKYISIINMIIKLRDKIESPN